MNSTWNKNISSFKIRFPLMADLYCNEINFISQKLENNSDFSLLSRQIFPFWNITEAKNGSLTASEILEGGGKIQLHSSYNPQREAEQAAAKIFESKKNNILFMGFGLGHQIIEFSKKIQTLQNADEYRVIVIEPDVLHFFAALTFTDWTSVFNIPQLILAIGCPENQIIPLIENSSQINVSQRIFRDSFIFSLNSFTAHAQNYFDNVKELIQRNKNKNDINAATYNKFAKLWIKNSLKNLKNLSSLTSCSTVSQLVAEKKNKFGDKFLLVAAGPTLEKNLPEISRLQKSLTIVCVETALKALLQAGIQPDFIIITDPQYWAYRHIQGLDSPLSTLVCPLSVYPSVFRFNCRQILLCSDPFPVSSFFEGETGSFGDLGAGGSVASSAWNLCYLLGAKEIYLAGLDLSYPTKETHIKGSSAEQTFHTISNKYATVDNFSIKSIYSAYPEYGENYAGNMVLTDSRMKMFAWWFESRIAACPDVKVFSLSEKSLKIPGVTFKDLNNLILEEKKAVENTSDFQTIALQIKKLVPFFCAALKDLQLLVNSALEKCIINGNNLSEDLKIIEDRINQNPLKTIIFFAEPTEKYLEEHKTFPPELAVYEKYQKDIKNYFSVTI